MIDARFHPLPVWPYESRPDGSRAWGQFKAPLAATYDLLDRELRHLGASDVVIEAGFQPHEIRGDGWPRSNARVPRHPGVAVHFDSSSYGHLRYATDVFRRWEYNLRAIALGLEALRKVDRYGITKGGEQYRGFAALPQAGIALGAGMTKEEAAKFIHQYVADLYDVDDIETGVWLTEAYRAAAKKLHPDQGGSADDFQRLQEAKRILEA